jgi:hypothetical protein
LPPPCNRDLRWLLARFHASILPRRTVAPCRGGIASVVPLAAPRAINNLRSLAAAACHIDVTRETSGAKGAGGCSE